MKDEFTKFNNLIITNFVRDNKKTINNKNLSLNYAGLSFTSFLRKYVNNKKYANLMLFSEKDNLVSNLKKDKDPINSNISQEYLNKRINLYSNEYLNTYKNNIKKSLIDYYKKGNKFNEKQLINRLTFSKYKDLSKEERIEYFNYNYNGTEFNKFMQSKSKGYGLKKDLKNIYGLRKKVLETPELYDGYLGSINPTYSYNPYKRIERIVKTENKALYTIQNIVDTTEQGAIGYLYKLNLPSCFLCRDLQNNIIFTDTIKRYLIKGGTDYSQVNTRKGKNYKGSKSRTTKGRGKNLYNNTKYRIPPIHPNSDSFLQPIYPENLNKSFINLLKKHNGIETTNRLIRLARGSNSFKQKKALVGTVGAYFSYNLYKNKKQNITHVKQDGFDYNSLISNVILAGGVLAFGSLLFHSLKNTKWKHIIYNEINNTFNDFIKENIPKSYATKKAPINNAIIEDNESLIDIMKINKINYQLTIINKRITKLNNSLKSKTITLEEYEVDINNLKTTLQVYKQELSSIKTTNSKINKILKTMLYNTTDSPHKFISKYYFESSDNLYTSIPRLENLLKI